MAYLFNSIEGTRIHRAIAPAKQPAGQPEDAWSSYYFGILMMTEDSQEAGDLSVLTKGYILVPISVR